MTVAEHSGERGVEIVKRFLDRAGIRYETLEHAPTFSTLEEAAAVGAEPRDAAKTLVLHDHTGWRLAVVPANHRLDIDRARRLLRATRHLRLATEDEMATAFPSYDVGALPPAGPDLPVPEAIDIRLLYRDRIVCAGGDHRHAIQLDPRDLLRLSEPRVGDICEPDAVEHRKGFSRLPTP
jgi:Ala-tRNA(Pro) deacylase